MASLRLTSGITGAAGGAGGVFRSAVEVDSGAAGAGEACESEAGLGDEAIVDKDGAGTPAGMGLLTVGLGDVGWSATSSVTIRIELPSR